VRIFFLASADKLVDGQYADRPQFMPIYDAIIAAPTTQMLDARVL
jgi:hypothetical protein